MRVIVTSISALFQQVCALDCQKREDCYSFQFDEDKGSCELGGFYDHRFLGDTDGVTVFIHVAGNIATYKYVVGFKMISF